MFFIINYIIIRIIVNRLIYILKFEIMWYNIFSRWDITLFCEKGIVCNSITHIAILLYEVNIEVFYAESGI